GFMLAYCDNDGSEVREHFMGSHEVQPVNGDRNRGFIDADVFGKITLLPKSNH
ncbi:MAG: sugar-binding protein, partial [Pseudoalteromonas sp.]|nr:sugar-binding protein [Pseudoalteromonas sp.]